MPHTEFDFLIIGQGLAGSLLSYELIQQGQRVMVIDNAHHASASTVAAGIINPITGHRLNLSDGFDEYWQLASPFYTQLEQTFCMSVIKPIPQTRLIKNKGQADYFKRRLTEHNYRTMLEPALNNTFKDTEYGCTNVAKTSIVDTQSILRLSQQWLRQQNSYRQESFNYKELNTTTGVHYGSIKAKSIVFCEGYQAIHNPWLNHLPFKLSKGEVITLALDSSIEEMLNWGSWLIPSRDGQYKLGSTYDWQNLDQSPPAAARTKLINSLNQHTNLNATIVRQEAGIRPTTTHRKPFIGPLSTLSHAYCFNGFGSKGCLLIPYYVKQLCQHLLHGKTLSEELSQWL